MPRETLESLRNKKGMADILVSAYKYLRDQNILKGVFKNPLVTQTKARVPDAYFEKLKIENTTFTNTPVLTYKNISTNKQVRIMTFSAAVKSNKPVEIDIYKDVTLTGASYVPYNDSTEIQKDISATSYSGGKLVGGVDIPETGGTYQSLGDEPTIFVCNPGETITFSITSDGISDLFMKVRLEALI